MTPKPELNPDDLADLIDGLFASGTRHINLEIGDETKVQTVSSTDCNPKAGPCALPSSEYTDFEQEE